MRIKHNYGHNRKINKIKFKVELYLVKKRMEHKKEEQWEVAEELLLLLLFLTAYI